MADIDDTFSSDDGNSNIPTPQTHFLDSNNKIISVPSEYDPETGADLTVSKAQNMNLGLTPIKVMVAPNGRQIPVKFNEINEALKLGLKPQEQIDAENSAQQSRNNLRQGNIPGYESGISDTAAAKFGNALSLGTSPNIAGVTGAIDAKLGGSSDSLSDLYKNNRDAYQATLNAQQQQRPILSNVASALGTGTLALGTGGLGAGGQIGTGAALSGLTGANESLNQGNNLQDVGEDTAKQALGGALGTGLGIGVGNAVGSAWNTAKNILPAVLPKNSPNLFRFGTQGENYLDPAVQQQAVNNVSGAPRDLFNSLMSSRQGVGKQKGNILNAIGQDSNLNSLDSSQNSLLESLTQNKNKLQAIIDNTELPTEKDAAQAGLDMINSSIKHINKNPYNPVEIDKVKQFLQEPLYDSQKNIINNDYGVKSILENSRANIQNLLEDNSPKTALDTSGFKDNSLGNVNKGYKAIVEAENPQQVFDTHYLTPNDVSDLSNGVGMSYSTRQKMNNLLDLNDEIKNNPDVSQDIKDQMNGTIQNLFDISRRGQAAQAINNTHGVSGVVNRTANLLGLQSQGLSNVLSQMSPKVREALQTSPEFRNAFLPALGLGTEQGIQNR